jgi:hypothetical protein
MVSVDLDIVGLDLVLGFLIRAFVGGYGVNAGVMLDMTASLDSIWHRSIV